MKYALFFYLFFVSFYLIAQQKFSKEISFVTDNDLYVSVGRDRYYTNGTFLNYRHLIRHKNKKLEKKIIEWQIGQEMFTPNKAVVQNIRLHDRPFAAYLYGSFSIKKVYKKNSILDIGLQMGIVGSNAFGQQLQDFIHEIYGFEEAVGWKYQIKNAFSLNFDATYSNFLIKNNSHTFDLYWVNSGRLGSVYTNISSGFLLRFGFIRLQKMVNSIAFNTNLNNKNTNFKSAVESFFFIKPSLTYALYDATLQGSFLNTTSEVTKELIPIVFLIEIGFKFTANRFNFGYVFNYNTSKSRDLRYSYGHKYGSIIVNYLLR